MATVYILFSQSLDKFYIGSCKDVTLRLREHLNEEIHGAFTSKASDWTLFLSIEELTYSQARLIEGHIKKMKSQKFIKNLKQYPELVSKLKKRFEQESDSLR